MFRAPHVYWYTASGGSLTSHDEITTAAKLPAIHACNTSACFEGRPIWQHTYGYYTTEVLSRQRVVWQQDVLPSRTQAIWYAAEGCIYDRADSDVTKVWINQARRRAVSISKCSTQSVVYITTSYPVVFLATNSSERKV